MPISLLTSALKHVKVSAIFYCYFNYYIMANKTKNFTKNSKKQKGEHKKERVKTEYQRERDAYKKQRKHGHNGVDII